jgi:tRNA threonylcarbamoyladenosine biosynthesis protein TsaE
MTLTRATSNVDETKRAGQELASILATGDIILLTGPLGAGKTAFTQGLAVGLGVVDRVTSPTFTLVRQHKCANGQGISVLHHADVYRTNSLDEIEDLALEELVEVGGVAVIEWGEMAEALLGRTAWRITIDVVDDDHRSIVVDEASVGPRLAMMQEWASR